MKRKLSNASRSGSPAERDFQPESRRSPCFRTGFFTRVFFSNGAGIFVGSKGEPTIKVISCGDVFICLRRNALQVAAGVSVR
jgi:hypothetical protein